MSELMWLLLTNTAIAVALSLVALLAMQCRRPALAHVIWLLVIVKLITPPVWRVAMPVKNEPLPVAIAPIVVNPMPVPIGPVAPTPIASVTPIASAPADIAAPPLVISWTQIILGVWIGGAIAYLMLAWRRFRAFRQLIEGEEPAGAWRDEVKSLAGRMRIRPPRVIVTSASISPMALILHRAATVVLPMPLLRTLDAPQRRAVIVHELAHLRRGDHFVRLFEILATAGLWWHPMLWIARWGLRDAEEQCCDAWVVSILPDERRRFADALVDSMEFISRSSLPAGASGLGHVRSLKRRLAMIVNRTAPKSLSTAGWIVVAMLAIGVLMTPVRGDGPNGASPAPGASLPATQAVDDNTRRIIEALLEAAQDSNDQVKAESFNAIVQFGGKAVPVLVAALEREATAKTAADLLSAMGVDAVDPLLAALGSRNPAIRESTLVTLRNIFVQKTGIGATRLFGAGEYGGPMMGMGAAPHAGMERGFGMPEALMPETLDLANRLFGPVAKATEDENVKVRRAATTLLNYVAQANPASYSPKPLVARLSDEDANVRLVAAQALATLRATDDAVVKALASVIGDRDENVQATALMALAAIGPDAKGATDAVLAALKSANPQLRMMAARALGAMEAKPQPADPSVPIGAAPGPEGEGVPGGIAPAYRQPGGAVPAGRPGVPGQPALQDF